MRRYHRNVQQSIKLFGEDRNNREQFLNVTVGGTIIRIHHPTNRKLPPLEYRPDAIITSRNRKKIVFQVLDSQARKNREIEADMFRAFLSQEVSIVVFITDSQASAENVERIWSILSENLAGYDVEDESMPITTSLIIPKEIRSAQGAYMYLNRSNLFQLISSHLRK